MKKIVLSAQVYYLPDRKKEKDAHHGPFSRLFAAALFLMAGFIVVALWISFPDVRIVLLMCVAIVLACGMYQIKRKL
jgi:glucan phosphoethanolaminetransferase (alkaline phosphatase superfamily)